MPYAWIGPTTPNPASTHTCLIENRVVATGLLVASGMLAVRLSMCLPTSGLAV
jgi:hypothetical protein